MTMLPSNLCKCIKWHKITLHFKVKSAHMHTTYILKPKFSSVSFYGEPILSYAPFLGKMQPKMYPIVTWTCSRSKISICKLLPNFGKSAQTCWNAHMCLLHTSLRPKFLYIYPRNTNFISFALRWAILELQSNVGKSALYDPKWPWHVQGQRYTYGIRIPHTCTSTRLKLSYVSPYDEPFLKLRPFSAELKNDKKNSCLIPCGSLYSQHCAPAPNNSWCNKTARDLYTNVKTSHMKANVK